MKFIVDIPNWDAASVTTTDGRQTPIGGGMDFVCSVAREVDKLNFSLELSRVDLDKPAVKNKPMQSSSESGASGSLSFA
jgi:hypothetical protein